MPYGISPYTVITIANQICFLETRRRSFFSFETSNLFMSDLVTSKGYGNHINILTAATENILGYPCIVQIFAGYPAEHNQSEFFLGHNNEVETITFEDLVSNGDDYHSYELTDLLFTI